MDHMLTSRRHSTFSTYTICLLTISLTSIVNAEFLSALSRCPEPCQSSGLDPAGWTYYHDLQILSTCKSTVLFQTNLYNAINDTQTHIGFRACTTSASLQAPDLIQDGITSGSNPKLLKRQAGATADALSWGKIDVNVDTATVSSTIAELLNYVKSNATGSFTIFSHREKTVAGLYIGPGIDVKSAIAVTDAFAVKSGAQKSRRAVQWCGQGNGTANRQSFGIIVDTQESVAAVQYALSRWAAGRCLQGDPGDNSWWSNTSPKISTTLASSSIFASSNSTVTLASPKVITRATCRYIQIQSGDGCWALAQRCGITQEQLQSYNGGASFCNNLQVDQYVCCSSGSPPDFSPQPTNGKCYPYTIKSGDTCGDIAKTYKMQVSGIENNNGLTWGWMGCKNLQIGQKICLSTGNPPFPATVANTVCGPQVNGTTPTADPKTWSNLNQCPLNACCDIWGQCGITSEFCTPSPSDTGAPGTAQPGTNGCISNCGADIIKSAAPDSFIRIGYFEAWNTNRPCLNMWPVSIPAKYSHVHFAFANITSDFKVDIGNVKTMFDQFKAKSGFKHILSFGGWAFSTAPQTYPIFRQGVTSAQRQTFATNVANFIMSNQLDGVDFDWEYPGAPDIPGIPPGSPQDGANYLEFLKMVRAALPAQYSISIAGPASYWYLKGFPIAKINEVVDYIVYMTYDLHGQWDYGNAFSDPGCSAGNCLRSHINRTETEQALSMITKAGVPARKVIVGQALYGRSFQMSQPGCYTDMCTFTGPASGAKPGKCTGTAGYISNWEIQQILDNPTSNAQQYYSPVAGDILVYDNNQWISYMTEQTYNSRLTWVQGLGFGGAVDWAMDLDQSYYGNGTEVGSGSGVVYVDPSVLKNPTATVACQPPCTFVFPPWILSSATTISQPPVTSTILNVYPSVQTLANSVTTTVFVSVTTVTTITLSPITTSTIDVWNVKWTDSKQTVLYLTSSLVFPPKILTQSSNTVTSSTKTSTLAGIIYTYSPGPFPKVTTTPGPPPPPPFTIGSIRVSVGAPKPTCVPGSLGCGKLCKSNCAPELPCIGICGCVGFGCPAGGGCLGPGCGGGGGSDGDENTKQSCSTKHTVTNCQVACSVTNSGTSTTSTCYSTQCVTVEGCSTTGSTSTSKTTTYACAWTSALGNAVWSPTDDGAPPPRLGGGGQFGYTQITGANAPTPRSGGGSYINCVYHGQDPHFGVTAQYCVCSSSTFPATYNSNAPGNSCAYSTKPAQTTSISTIKSSVTSNCMACTYTGDQGTCTSVPKCTPKSTTTITTTITPTTTVTVTVTPTADCKFWDEGWGWRFEVYNIKGWATDGGRSLKKEEGGCGAMTGWSWTGPGPNNYPYVYFNLPFFIKAGCVERAIVSAGGPKISCAGQGLDIKKRHLGVPRSLQERQINDSVSQSQVAKQLTATKQRQSASLLPPSITPSYTYAASLRTMPHKYITATWTGTDKTPVVITTTLTTAAPAIVVTTVIPVKPTVTNALLASITTMP